MANNGNGQTPTQQLETLAQVAMANPPSGAVEDFLTRVEGAAQLLADVGRELGHVGEQDEREFIADATELRNRMKEIVARRVARKERELGDLKRILGELK